MTAGRGRGVRASAPLVALAAVAVHVWTLGFGFTNLDDRDLLVDDRAFLLRGGLREVFGRPYLHVVDAAHGYFRPMVTLSTMFDARWGAALGEQGEQALPYHLTNVGLHAVASVLVLALLARLGIPRTIATVAAVVFAVHPVLADAVAWIPGRNDSLLAVFALAAWLGFENDRASAGPSGASRGWRWRIGHGVFFGLALLTKETAVGLPLVWALSALLDRHPRDRRRPRQRSRGATLAFHLPLWTVLVATRLALGSRLAGVGAGLDGFGAGFCAGLDLREVPSIVVAMLGKLAIPVHPSVLGVPEDLALWPGLLTLIALGAAVELAPRAGAEIRRGIVGLGLVSFVLTLVPAFATRGSLLLDSRLYLPACGVLLSASEIARAFAQARREPLEPRLVVAFSAIGAVVLGALTVGYEGAFRDPRSFARAAVLDAPHSAMAHFCLGQSAQRDGDDDRAMAEYAASLALAPGEVVHNDVAVIDMKRAHWADAERELREELALNPRYARAYENLAIVLRHEGRYDEAARADDAARAAR